jgi:hypothetical protein
MCETISSLPCNKWVRSVMLFLKPKLIIPGKWLLYEYYSEPEDELLHYQANYLKENNLYWEIVLEHGGLFKQKSNLPIRFLNDCEICRWKISGNYLKIKDTQELNFNEEFQIAILKDSVRLLKKDISGRIIFFGFFRKQEF